MSSFQRMMHFVSALREYLDYYDVSSDFPFVTAFVYIFFKATLKVNV